MRDQGWSPRAHVEASPALARVLGALRDGTFSHHEPERWHGLVHQLLHHDPYFLTADFERYTQAQREVDTLFANPAAWAARALRNIAGMGRFSVDRTIGDYVREVWNRPEDGRVT